MNQQSRIVTLALAMYGSLTGSFAQQDKDFFDHHVEIVLKETHDEQIAAKLLVENWMSQQQVIS